MCNLENQINLFMPFVGIVDEHAWSMLHIHFREENSFVLSKPYLAEVYIGLPRKLTTKGSMAKSLGRKSTHTHKKNGTILKESIALI